MNDFIMTKEGEKLLHRLYLREGETCWDDLVNRVAHALGKDESQVKQFKELLLNFYFLPGTPTLVNAGMPKGQLSSCFVIPVEDDLESIFEAIKCMALIHKTGGGTGFSFSKLRENGAPVGPRAGCASGPVSFMRVFNAASEEIKQGGMRRGANMSCLLIDHLDIIEFIMAKGDKKSFGNFNFSVMIPDSFFQALKEDTMWKLKSRGGAPNKEIDPYQLWDLIATQAWNAGEPGVLFYDTINRMNTLPDFKIEAVNACSELPMLNWEACNLGSINLVKCVNLEGKFDWALLDSIVHEAVVFLNRVIDCNCFPFPQISKATLFTRKVGMGIMGLADALVLMRIKYGSDECISFLDELMEFISKQAWKTSVILAEQRGAFEGFAHFHPYLSTHPVGKNVYNATLTTIAPTGTISILAGISTGIEPIFKLQYTRSDTAGVREVMHPLLYKIDRDKYKEFLVEAHQVSILDHLRVLAVIQKWTDNAVSKTINLPFSATILDIKDIYKWAYEMGCKGVTVFRYGSREGVLS